MGLMKAVVSVRRTVKMVKQTSREVLDSLPVVTDPSKLAIMALLNRLGEWSYVADGLFDWSSAALSSFCIMSLLVMGDVDTAHFIAERSMQMQERIKSEAGKARSFLILHALVLHHEKPVQSFSKIFLECYQSGMRTGDKPYAMWALFWHVFLQFMVGKPLNVIEEQCQASITQAVELKEEDQASCLRLYWQMCFNLMGSSNSTVELIGKAMDEREVVFTSS
eukprot:4415182-Ditylum_brightwellii.AAC.1